MSRKPTDIVQYKLRIREKLRRRIEKAAEKNKISANQEMVSRLEISFDQESEFHLEGVALILRESWSRVERMLERLVLQGELLDAVSDLLGEIEELPPKIQDQTRLKAAVERVKRARATIELEATRFRHMRAERAARAAELKAERLERQLHGDVDE